jgi:sugar O-acyltransferase (sialic acid O-acetyltransferase NeuD family)
MNKVLVVGTSGLAKEIVSWSNGLLKIDGFIDITKDNFNKYNLPGEFYHENDIDSNFKGTKNLLIAIGDPILKQKLFLKYQSLGFCFEQFISPSCVISNSAKIGKGAIICPNCVLGADTEIKDFVLINYLSGIGHDTIVNNFSQINPGVQIGGNVIIGEKTLIGSGTTIVHGAKIGNECRVASGSVVFNEIKDGFTVLGNPAKKIF